LRGEEHNLAITLAAIVVSSAATLLAPMIIGHTVDSYIQRKNFQGVLVFSAILLCVYVVGMVASYIQTLTIGGVARRMIFNLRNRLFLKLQELPITFSTRTRRAILFPGSTTTPIR